MRNKFAELSGAPVVLACGCLSLPWAGAGHRQWPGRLACGANRVSSMAKVCREATRWLADFESYRDRGQRSAAGFLAWSGSNAVRDFDGFIEVAGVDLDGVAPRDQVLDAGEVTAAIGGALGHEAENGAPDRPDDKGEGQDGDHAGGVGRKEGQ